MRAFFARALLRLRLAVVAAAMPSRRWMIDRSTGRRTKACTFNGVDYVLTIEPRTDVDYTSGMAVRVYRDVGVRKWYGS